MKRTPLKRGGPLQRKSQPVRKPMKKSRKKAATAAEKRHMNRLAEMGCIICFRPAEIHHVTSDRFKRITRSNERTVPLCPDHHRTGKFAVESIGHDAFALRFGIDLLWWADEAWRQSEKLHN